MSASVAVIISSTMKMGIFSLSCMFFVNFFAQSL
jgi:hypothetical protein